MFGARSQLSDALFRLTSEFSDATFLQHLFREMPAGNDWNLL